MAMFHPPRGVIENSPPMIGPGLPVQPPPDRIEPTDPAPWIEAVLPPEGESRPPPQMPPLVVIEPVEQPPKIVPPPPDITPETIVPWVFEDPIPEPMPIPPLGTLPVVQPPASLMALAGLAGLGTFMVYVGSKLVLTMAAALGTSLGKSAGAMLVGAVQKQLFRGTTIRFHSGQSFGSYQEGEKLDLRGSSVSYMQAWRMLPQEFSYWEK